MSEIIDEQMDPQQAAELLGALEEAHYNAAINNKGNISATAAMVVYQGSLDPMKAVAAGILSIGGTHAPVLAARELYKMWEKDQVTMRRIIRNMVSSGQRIPGFGNSYFKEGIDPTFQEAYNKYAEVAGPENTITELARYVNFVVEEVKGKQDHDLHPNAAIITAGICEITHRKPLYEIYAFISGRSQAWLQMIVEPTQYNSTNLE